MKQNNIVAFFSLSFSLLFFISCGGFLSKNHNNSEEKNDLTSNKNKEIRTMSSNEKSPGNETAVLAGGCFWCLDAVYQKLEGVTAIECGYSNGTKKNPTYEEVCSGVKKLLNPLDYGKGILLQKLSL